MLPFVGGKIVCVHVCVRTSVTMECQDIFGTTCKKVVMGKPLVEELSGIGGRLTFTVIKSYTI